MTQPYQNAINNNMSRFAQLGLSVLNNTDGEIVFSDGVNRLRIGTERNSALTLTFGAMGSDGCWRALIILVEALDPHRAEVSAQRVKALTTKDNLSQKSYDEMLSDGSLERFLSLVIELQLDFLIAHRGEVFSPSKYTQELYELKLKAVSERLRAELFR